MSKRQPKARCNMSCLNCEYAIPLGDGDFLCDINNSVVIVDYEPADDIVFPTKKELEDYVG